MHATAQSFEVLFGTYVHNSVAVIERNTNRCPDFVPEVTASPFVLSAKLFRDRLSDATRIVMVSMDVVTKNEEEPVVGLPGSFGQHRS